MDVKQPNARRWLALPFKIKIEPRLNTPRWLPTAVSLGAIILGLVLGVVMLRLAGQPRPFRAFGSIAQVLFGSLGGISDVLVQATPLILVGLACSVAFSMKLWNIGAEGQFFIGAFAASAIVLTPILPAETPGWIFIPVMMVAGLIGGALWGLVSGYLKAKYNVNEIITSLMMNYIAIEWNNFFIFGVWSEGGFQMSPRFPRTAWLPRLADYAKEIPGFGGLTLHLGLLFGPIAAVIVWFILYRSKWGYE
ncbi:MAG: ABC transporter permease, partial [Anaerolineales bacterium]